jgi:AraC family transcriptional regulator of adaptative response / DNA-3-methyladenine glycosylase II
MPGIERVDGNRYRRAVAIGDSQGIVEIVPGRKSSLLLRVPASLTPHIRAVSDAARRLFDLGADPRRISEQLGADPQLAPLVGRYPGLRVPGAWNPFETAVRAILGQQISVRGATTLAGRIVAAYGERLGEAGEEGLERDFPSPARLRRVRFGGVGLTGARARSIRALATAVDCGVIDPGNSPDFDAAANGLTALPGIGPWTAHYVAMRAGGEPDAFPSGDLALRRAAEMLNPSLKGERALVEMAESWRPWRSYATMLLWRWYTDTNGKRRTE